MALVSAIVRVTKPRRRVQATCSEGCELPARVFASQVRDHVRATGHDVTVADTRTIRFVAVTDEVA